MSRFDYVKYDELATAQQGQFKEEFEKLEVLMMQHMDSRAKSLAVTKLEEAYMWIGKMIRDELVKRKPETVLQEERKDG